MSEVEIGDIQAATYVAPNARVAGDRRSLSLLGGPLHEAGKRLGLVHGSNTIALGLAIGGGLWLILLLVAIETGNVGRAFSMASIAAHLRFLVVIPLMFICETWLDPQVASFIRSAVESGVIPPSQYPRLDHDISRLTRVRDSSLPDVLCVVAALPLVAAGTSIFSSVTPRDPAAFKEGLALSIALLANLTVFRYLVFRWCWRLILWWWLLWRVSRLQLHLVAAHPDRAGGLGGLEIVQFQFLPLIVAVSVLLSSTYAEVLARGTVPVSVIYPAAIEAILIGMIIVFAPLFVFCPALIATRERGFAEYMVFASRYVTAFHDKWITTVDDTDLLGTADVQSLADLSNSVGIVREMRLVPVSLRLLAQVAVVAFIPMLPLSLFKHSVTELLQRLLMRLLGA
jgi:hypothetical protein